MTTTPRKDSDVAHPEAEMMRLLAELNLRDDGSDGLALRFVRALARIDDDGLELLGVLTRMAEGLADHDLERSEAEWDRIEADPSRAMDGRALLIAAALELPAVCVPEALRMMGGLLDDE